MIRDDLSEQLIHLTREKSDQTAAHQFAQILQDRKLLGGRGLIKGQFLCVCFTEAPVAKLNQIFAVPDAHKMRYKPFGIMVTKSWLFSQGGRPVIYQPDDDYHLLPECLKYRHVRYDGPDSRSDFTWEREWRIQRDELPLDLDNATAVVPTRAWEEWFQKQHPRRRKKWHFIVLEDLGISIPSQEPPREK